MPNKKYVVKPRHFTAFRIWLDLLGYQVTSMADGEGFNFRSKKQFGYVTKKLRGNDLASQLGSEFEWHLRQPDFKE